MRSLFLHPCDNSIRCLCVGSDDAVRKCVDHPALVICHAVTRCHTLTWQRLHYSLHLLSRWVLPQLIVMTGPGERSSLFTTHHPPLCSPWVCLIQCFGPQWLSIPVMFTFCVRHLYARLMSVTLLLSSHNREEWWALGSTFVRSSYTDTFVVMGHLSDILCIISPPPWHLFINPPDIAGTSAIPGQLALLVLHVLHSMTRVSISLPTWQPCLAFRPHPAKWLPNTWPILKSSPTMWIERKCKHLSNCQGYL